MRTSEPSVPVKILQQIDHHLAKSIQPEPVKRVLRSYPVEDHSRQPEPAKRVLRSYHVEDHSQQPEPLTSQSQRDDIATHDSRPDMITTNVIPLS